MINKDGGKGVFTKEDEEVGLLQLPFVLMLLIAIHFLISLSIAGLIIATLIAQLISNY